ncbi:MAG: molybdenum cofactor guanylyltransferase [Acidobacteriota bacterium]|nr:molybdenum cofactor guanylyltransferase [Acidobacteriota bacterium]
MFAEEICAVILAGGRSRRMGRNKALLDIGGRPLIQTLAERLGTLARDIFVAANDPEAYRFLGLPVVADRFPGQGPLAGLHAVMSEHPRAYYVVAACDLPNLPTALLRRMLDAAVADGIDAVIPRSLDGRAHPLSAVYRRTCLPVIEKALAAKANKVIETFLGGDGGGGGDALSIRWFEQAEGAFAAADLLNVNTPEDLGRLP